MASGETYNLRLGGIHDGWIGEMSVPITSQFGYSSAKSLRTVNSYKARGFRFTHIAQDPVPVAISTTF